MLGVRVRYRIYFDEVLADYDHAWEYAATGVPVPRLERDMLAAVVIGPATPLQLRSGGLSGMAAGSTTRTPFGEPLRSCVPMSPRRQGRSRA